MTKHYAILCNRTGRYLALSLGTVLTRAELAVYVQSLQRRAHAFRIKDCKKLNLVIRYMKRHKRGLKPVALQHPLKLPGFTDAAFKA